jgi:DNA polymerase-3 subunit delta'
MLAEVQHQEEGVKFLRRFVEGHLVSPVLLIGPEGVGRRFSILQAVQEVFCTGTKQKGCTCYSCFVLEQGTHPDWHFLNAPTSDIGIDAIREVVARAKDYPSSASMRCFVIDGADRFTGPAAADAFLKTLEEPPSRSRFFLLAETYDSVPPTIRSRCGRINYNRLPEAFLLSVLNQHEEDDAKALVYSRMGEGSVGSAVRYLGSGKINLRDQVLQILQQTLDGDLPSLFASVNTMEQDLVLALKFLEQVLHDILLVRVDPMRIINVDRQTELLNMGNRATLKVWVNLANKVRALQSQYRTTSLHLPFHLKTILVESF